MTQQAVAAIDALKPYKGGNDVLWQLHELNNVDKHRLILTVGSAVRSTDLGDFFAQCAAPGSLLSEAKGLSAFFMAGDNDYPLKVGMVVFTAQTTTDVKKLTIPFELVPYEKGVIGGVSLSETMKDNCLESKSIRTTPVLGHMTILWRRIDEIMFDIHIVR